MRKSSSSKMVQKCAKICQAAANKRLYEVIAKEKKASKPFSSRGGNKDFGIKNDSDHTHTLPKIKKHIRKFLQTLIPINTD